MSEPPLVEVLRTIQARGAIGSSPIEEAIVHAGRFASRVPPEARRVADLGSGGGLPGLVVASKCPWVEVLLVERRMTRADLLRRAVVALGLSDRVHVHAGDVREVALAAPHSFDVVTSRSFGPPAVTARWAAELLISGGVLLVSEPPTEATDRWSAALLERCGLVDHGRDQGIRRLARR